MPQLNPDGDASGIDLRTAIRCSLLVMALALVPLLPALALSVRAYDDTQFGCIVGRDPDKPGTYPSAVIMKLSDGSTVRFDLSRFKFKDGNSLANDECYRVRVIREGGVLFAESFDREQPTNQGGKTDSEPSGSEDGGGQDEECVD